MTPTNLTAAPVTPAFGDTSAVEQEFGNCLAFAWLPVLAVVLSAWDPFRPILDVILRPVFLALEAVGLADGWFAPHAAGAVYLLAAMLLASLASAVLAAAMVAVKHGVCGLVRSANRR